MILNYENYLSENSIGKIFYNVEYSNAFKKFMDTYGIKKSVQMLFEAMISVETDISYIDLGKRNDTVSYLSYDKFTEIRNIDLNFYETDKRQEMKFGKFLTKIFNDSKKDISQTQKEVLINLYKNYNDSLSGKYGKMMVVTGEKIRYWYNEKNYKSGNGTLNRSCMKEEEEGYRLSVYVDNPKQISMLILLDENEKLMGRALIWKLINGGIYMDRIYTVFEHDIEVFNKYAFDNGFESTKYLEDKLPKKSVLKVKLDYLSSGKYHNYPFMDTFQYCNLNSNILSNYPTENRQFEIILNWW